MKKFALVMSALVLTTNNVFANQTTTLSPVLSGSALPFNVVIEKMNFQLPVGVQSGAIGVYKGLWVLIAGRTDGLHGFGSNAFPPYGQNVSVYVVNPATGATSSRALADPSSGLTQQQIDSLSVTSPQFYQEGDTLYMSGGFGIDTASGTFTTKPVLTAINLSALVQWVTNASNKSLTAVSAIRQIYDPIFQITGGKMTKVGNVTQLIFGETFTGDDTINDVEIYSDQIRQFQITGGNGQFGVNILNSLPANPDPNFRRRDLNVIPTLINTNNQLKYGYTAYAGVFTPDNGVWTVPVTINQNGNPVMPDPGAPSTFKQAMNQYRCANAALYSNKFASMYNILFGGITYGFFQNGVFLTDAQLPFTNEVTTVQRDRNGNFTQYLMDNQYPVILATQPNPGNPLLFGTMAYFLPGANLQYPNGVISMDALRKPTVLGYIVGGVASTLPNTNTPADSFASPYVFRVTFIPK